MKDIDETKLFTYPSRQYNGIYKVTALYYLFLFLLFTFLYTYNYDIKDAFWGMLISLFMGIFFYILFNLDIHFMIRNKYWKIKIDKEKIQVGKREIRWKNVEKIKHGFFLFKSFPYIMIIPKGSEMKFWTLKLSRKSLRIEGYKFVYKEIIPAIKVYRPDIEIPKACNDIIDNPKRKKYFKIALSLFAVFEMLAIIVMMLFLSNYRIMYIPLLSIFLLQQIGNVIHLNRTQLINEDFNDALLRAIILSTLSFSVIILIFFILIFPPIWLIKALMTMMVINIFITLIIYFTLMLLKKVNSFKKVKKQIIFFTILTFCSFFSIIYFYVQAIPIVNISEKFNSDGSLIIWGNSGRYVASYFFDEKDLHRYIYDTKRTEKIELPNHQSKEMIKYMDSKNIIRLIRVNKDESELYIYNLKSKKESLLDHGYCLKFSNREPISPNKEKIVWINYDSEYKLTVKLAKLPKDSVTSIENIDITVPKNCKWSEINWVNDSEIILIGKVKNDITQKKKKSKKSFCIQKGKLVLFNYNIKSKKSSTKIYDHKALSWQGCSMLALLHSVILE